MPNSCKKLTTIVLRRRHTLGQGSGRGDRAGRVLLMPLSPVAAAGAAAAGCGRTVPGGQLSIALAMTMALAMKLVMRE